LTISKKLAKYLGEGTSLRAAEGNFRRFSFLSNHLVCWISGQEAAEYEKAKGSATCLGRNPTPPLCPSSLTPLPLL
jgi:hypothetical protein